jgi:predicted RNA binding protein YcfA (HicA-like mRNA interferase family)
MGKINVISGKKFIQILEIFGWQVVRRKSSHIILIKPGEIITLSVPNHKELSIGTLRSILRNADISIDEFNSLLS